MEKKVKMISALAVLTFLISGYSASFISVGRTACTKKDLARVIFESRYQRNTYRYCNTWDLSSIKLITPPRVILKTAVLRVLDLSNNEIEYLGSYTFSYTTGLRYLRINNNKFKFSSENNEHLFENLRNLIELKLGSNKIDYLPEKVFQNLVSLIELRLEENIIKNISENIFKGTVELKKLFLNNNLLFNIEENSFSTLIKLEELHLEKNKLQNISTNLFKNNTALQKLYLGSNQIDYVDNYVFQTLTNLELLTLNNNKIKIIHTNAFKHLYSLANLHLSYNQIKKIQCKLFQDSKKISELLIDNNNLTEIQEGAIDALTNLKHWDISNNKLSLLPNISNLFEIETISFHDNNWDCNCFVYYLFKWWEKNDKTQNIYCTNTNEYWHDLTSDSFKCEPIVKIFPELGNISIREGSDLNLTCLVTANPPPEYPRWKCKNDTNIFQCLNKREPEVRTITRTYGDITTETTLFIPKIKVRDAMDYICTGENEELDKNIINETISLFVLPVKENVSFPLDYQSKNNLTCSYNITAVQKCLITIPSTIEDCVIDDINPNPFMCQSLSLSKENNITNVSDWSCNLFKKFSAIKYLSLRGNKISEINNEHFLHLNNLRVLVLSRNRIKSISNKAFANLKRLEQLYLNHNKLNTIPDFIFKNTPRLHILFLDHNFIEKLDQSNFAGLKILQKLFLHNNFISQIGRRTFVNLTGLKVLNLAQNKLINIEIKNKSVFKPLKSLELLDLSNNQIRNTILYINRNLKSLYLQSNRIHSLKDFYFEYYLDLEIIDFSDNDLKRIDHLNFEYTQRLKILILNKNRISSLDNNNYYFNNSLKILSLDCNEIKYLNSKAFKTLSFLTTLSLEQNFISEIEVNTFNSLKSLQNLSLSNNKLSTLPENIFNKNILLQEILLNKNHIQYLPEKIFSHLKNLAHLSLDDNLLTTININVFPKPNKIKILKLKNNRWICDCSLQELFNFWQNLNMKDGPFCDTPIKSSWQKLRNKKFQCKPIVKIEHKEINIEKGQNLTLSCVSIAYPGATVQWMDGNKILKEVSANQTTVLLNFTIFNVSKIDEKKYSCVSSNDNGINKQMTKVNVLEVINSYCYEKIILLIYCIPVVFLFLIIFKCITLSINIKIKTGSYNVQNNLNEESNWHT